MTNEELVAHIQAGEVDQLPALWEQVERFVAMEARRVSRRLKPGAGVTFDDLYQSGYLALVAAVKGFDAERGMAFIGYLAYQLKTAFAKAGGWQGRKRDPLQEAVSLSAPLGDSEGDGTLEDLVADPTDAYAGVEADVWRRQLREALDQALDTLPNGGGELLRKRYLQGQSAAQIAEKAGCAKAAIWAREQNAILAIKRTSYAGRLYAFMEGRTNYYHHVGVSRFNTTHTSAVEALVQRREELAEAFHKRHDQEKG